MENREIPIDPSAFDYIQLQYDDAVNDDALDYADALLDEGEYSDPFEAVAQQELRSQFWRMMIDLVGNLRDISIFVARTLDGKTYRDISERYGISKARVARICDRVFEKMKYYSVLNMLFDHGFEEEVYREALARPISKYYNFSDNVHEYFREQGYLYWQGKPCIEAGELTDSITEEVNRIQIRLHHSLNIDNKYTFIIDTDIVAMLLGGNNHHKLYITYEQGRRSYRVELERMSIKRDLQKVVIEGKFRSTPTTIEIELYEFLHTLGLSADLLNQPEDQISSAIVDAVTRIGRSNPSSFC